MQEDKKDLAYELRELLKEAEPILDEIAELCTHDAFLKAYVPGNLWAERYGYIGKTGLDYLDEWIEKAIAEAECTNCGETFGADDMDCLMHYLDIGPEDLRIKNLEGQCDNCICLHYQMEQEAQEA